ncbi:Acetolactate synthase large subunit [Prochlorococcus marinus subsp. pastoris str. CCMP1986]|uniref:Acetolactate synthase n=1 Tax=Prochlorococcus marinus subsp. pastoris (strain CCMP1986 / NIES-2087 / MED4) TaxID=59919 RepID=Q7V2F4_PROMP|nr:biosynthetic-type acetolactate synthase large subunit [Prochlorococcus marinus]KGF86123.1 Acetolactate synthase large subunit [Prochlorococcus marinus str. EQPAC1]CAE18985.1 Acetolactate synthase large subunit [Prochlorococcus marinus subsp. pastoris str. CCMP1986]
MTLTSTSLSKDDSEKNYPIWITGAEALMDSLKVHDVKVIFGYPGGAILPIYDAVHKAENDGWLKHYMVRHEQGGSHAADGYARSTGEVGVCFGTSGPGATNLVTGIATAQMDSVPLVVVTGQVPRPAIGTDAFQETDIFGITLPIVKHSWVVRDPSDIAKVVSEAFFIASSGRPGPVLIDIPKDVGQEFFNYERILPGKIIPKGFKRNGEINDADINQAIELIQESSRPLLYVGGGAISSGAHEEVETLANNYQIPVTTTLMGKGVFDERDDLSVGMLGMHGTAYANFAVTECDLLIAVGARFDDRVTGKLDTFAPSAKVIHIDIDPAEVNKNRRVDVAIVSDVAKALSKINEKYFNNKTSCNTKNWLEKINFWKNKHPLFVPPEEGEIYPQEVLLKVRDFAPEAFITTDVGQHQMWAAQYLRNAPRRWISSAGLGTMGFGLPAAMGVKAALPNEEVICIAGDASVLMNIQELGTLSQYGLNIKLVIINNRWQGMVRQWQESFYEERYSSSDMSCGEPDFVKLAESFGVKGFLISERKQLLNEFKSALDFDGPALINVRVRRGENCYPMVPPGKSNAQMVGYVNSES